MSDIIDMAYSPQDKRLRIDLTGNPVDSMQRAGAIAAAVIGDLGWRVESIDGRWHKVLGDFVTKIVVTAVD